jgi:hypothetical protein
MVAAVLLIGLVVERTVIIGLQSAVPARTPSHSRASVARKMSPPHRAAPAAPAAVLESDVSGIVAAQRDAAAEQVYGAPPTSPPVVTLTRVSRDRSWVFGSATIPVPQGNPAIPQTALFLAHRSGTQWIVALSGTPAFNRGLRLVPQQVVNAGERQALASYSSLQGATAVPVTGPSPQASGVAVSPSPPAAAPRTSPAPTPSPQPTASGNGAGTNGAGARQVAAATSPPAKTGAAGSSPGGSPRGGSASPSPRPTVSPSAHPSGSPAPSAGRATGTPAGGQAAGPALMLPWQVGESWQMITSPVRAGAAGLSFSSVTFAGGDGRVLAAASGRLYRLCDTAPDQSLIEIIAPDGTATEYYQMANETAVPDGSLVQAGTYLGMTGTATSCGGTIQEVNGAYSPEVEFAVLRGGAAASMNGLPLGGWTFRTGSAAPGEWAQRGGTTVVSGGLLQNYGLPVAAPVQHPAPHPSPHPVPAPDPKPDPTASLSVALLPASPPRTPGSMGGFSTQISAAGDIGVFQYQGGALGGIGVLLPQSSAAGVITGLSFLAASET